MNKIIKSTKDGVASYKLTCEDGSTYDCSVWFEKKTNAWHVKLPKDNPSGRTYVRMSNFDNSDTYEFETKTEHRTGLVGGGWRSKMTPAEMTEMAELEARIEAIKKAASAREVEKVDPNSVEGIEAQIAKLTAKLAAKKPVEVVVEQPVKKNKKAQ